MGWDSSIVTTDDTAYVWGGWDSSGYRTEMLVVDLLTGARRSVPISSVRFQTQGPVTNSNWNWTSGKLLYLTSTGDITQTRPTSGPVTIIGIAWTATMICLCPEPPK